MKNYLYNLATDQTRGGVCARLLQAVLWLVSCLYAICVRLIRGWRLAHAVRLPCTVISVGNLTVGGTGKTTLVEYIARAMRAQGRRVAVLSRGYKRPRKVSGAQVRHPSAQSMGDEPYLLKCRLGDIPVLVSTDRVKSARAAVAQFNADTVIIDDGMQQWGIKKDLELVALDGRAPFGNGHVLPRGILREPPDALARADVLVFTKTADVPSAYAKLGAAYAHSRALMVACDHEPELLWRLGAPAEGHPVDSLAGNAVVAFSGIGDAGSFESLAASPRAGALIVSALRFSDHHPYTSADLDRILQVCRAKGARAALTTEKDAVRLEAFADHPLCRTLGVWVLRIRLAFTDNEQGLRTRLSGL
jgi:tetraacyldisaccharide 4'-kinase